MREEGWDGEGDGEKGERETKCQRETETIGGRDKEDKVEKEQAQEEKKTVVRGQSLLTAFLLEKNSYFDFNLLKNRDMKL